MDLAWLLRDTRFALLAITADVVFNLSLVSGVFLIALRFDGIGGLSTGEVLLMLSYSTLVTGLFQMFFAGCNTGHISRRIGRGQLEHMLIQPVPLPVQLLTEGFLPFSGSSNVVTGTALICYALSRLEIAVTGWWVLSLIGNMLVTLSLILAQSYLWSSAALYAPVAAEEIATDIIDGTGTLAVFPLSGMPAWLQIPLVTALPAGLMAWFPTLSLLGKPPMGLTAAFPLVFMILVATLASIFFRKGMRHYVTHGINRYSAVGHRR